MRVWISGSTGLLGTHLVEAFLARGIEVRAVARSPEKAQRVLPECVQIVKGDLTDLDSMIASLSGCDVAVHAAAYFREYFGRGSHEETLRRLNVDATLALARAAHQSGVQSFLFISSGGTVGRNLSGAPSDETTPPGPLSHSNLYFRSKIEAEAELGKLDTQGMRKVVILPGWMFGPKDSGPTGSGQLVKDLLTKGGLQLVSGTVTIADARDVAEGIVEASLKGRDGERYILGGNPMEVITAFRIVRDAAGQGRISRVPLQAALFFSKVLEPLTRLLNKPNPIPLQGLLTLSEGETLSSAKAERELGVNFRPFEETARDTVAFFREQIQAGKSG